MITFSKIHNFKWFIKTFIKENILTVRLPFNSIWYKMFNHLISVIVLLWYFLKGGSFKIPWHIVPIIFTKNIEKWISQNMNKYILVNNKINAELYFSTSSEFTRKNNNLPLQIFFQIVFISFNIKITRMYG